MESGEQSGRKCVSVAAALRAEQGLYKRNFIARVSQWRLECLHLHTYKPKCHIEPVSDRES